MSMQGPSNLSKAFTSMTWNKKQPEKRRKQSEKSSTVSAQRAPTLTCRMYERARNSRTRTQAFDASNSIGRRSSRLVGDERQLPKVLAPRAHCNIYLLFFLLFFRLFRKEKEKRIACDTPEKLLSWKKKKEKKVIFTAYPASLHGDSNLTRLHDVEAVGQIPLQTNSHWDVTVLKWANKRWSVWEQPPHEEIHHLSDDLLRITVGPGRYDVHYLHPLRELQTGEHSLYSVSTVKLNRILMSLDKKQTEGKGKRKKPLMTWAMAASRWMPRTASSSWHCSWRWSSWMSNDPKKKKQREDRGDALRRCTQRFHWINPHTFP